MRAATRNPGAAGDWPGAGGRARRRRDGRGGGAGAARGGVSAEAAGAAAAPGSGSGGRAMWLLGPLCLLLSSAAGESGGGRRTSRGARGAGRGALRSVAFASPPGAGRSPGVGVRGGRTPAPGWPGPCRGAAAGCAPSYCVGVRAGSCCAARAGGALCAARVWGARRLPRLGVARVWPCV
ncbi:hypothetical protein P7K49_021924 [Saguinus oedipus]|uniref:Shadow of prion protein n=1 Tax=Saguinus oedipus TaxID=9490 RepID=A0ABQ9UU44_SAGOE|nr:hypothetical protein P7K49_021924 [Saguinus oedipus]